MRILSRLHRSVIPYTETHTKCMGSIAVGLIIYAVTVPLTMMTPDKKLFRELTNNEPWYPSTSEEQAAWFVVAVDLLFVSYFLFFSSTIGLVLFPAHIFGVMGLFMWNLEKINRVGKGISEKDMNLNWARLDAIVAKQRSGSGWTGSQSIFEDFRSFFMVVGIFSGLACLFISIFAVHIWFKIDSITKAKNKEQDAEQIQLGRDQSSPGKDLDDSE